MTQSSTLHALHDVVDAHALTQRTDIKASVDQVAESNQSSTINKSKTNKGKKNVVFETAEVIEFEPTLWTATVASDGVPVGLSSTVRRRTRRRLDSLEGERAPFRVHRQEYMEHGYLEPEERLDMLEAAGHSVAIVNHVERDTVRINRERWESNEYDLLYQFGLGEEAVMDLDEDIELMLSQGSIFGFTSRQADAGDDSDDDDDDMAGGGNVVDEDEEPTSAPYFYYPSTSNQDDGDNQDDMDEDDVYGSTCKYEEWAWDYTTDCILGDNDDSDQFAKDSQEPTSTDDEELPEMSSSPTDISSSRDCVLVTCSKPTAVSSSSSSSSPSRIVM